MTKQDLSQIALKILGIYVLLESIQFISGILNVFSFPGGDAPFEQYLMASSMVVSFLILLLAGLFLIRRTDRITSKFFPSGSIDNIDVNASQIQAIAFSIMGVVLIVTTIPELLQFGVNTYFLMSRAGELGAEFEFRRDTLGFGINLLGRVILGVVLFISGNSISNLWRRITDRIKYEANIT